MPVPDIDRTDLFICLGANPLASNGSIMTAPDVKGAAQGDPRARRQGDRPRSAPHRDRGEGRSPPVHPARHRRGAAARDAPRAVRREARDASAGSPATGARRAARRGGARGRPERAAPITGIAAAEIRELARALATTQRAVLYGRIGVCTQEFGGLAAWLCYALNALTGHLDEPGGLMFTTPAVDPLPLAALLGFDGGFARWTSRVSAASPSSAASCRSTVLAEEIETPGDGQIRALITSAGNPVLSAPGGPRLERAFAHARLHGLDRSVPQRDHAPRARDPAADLAARALALRRRAQRVRGAQRREVLAAAVRARAPTRATTGRSASSCGRGSGCPRGSAGRAARARAARQARARGDPRSRAAHRSAWPRSRRAVAREAARRRRTASTSARSSRGCPERLAHHGQARSTSRRRSTSTISPRLERRFATPPADGLVLIGRRHLRSNNSWMHNSERLVKGPPRCTLMIHPDDAAARGLADGGRARVVDADAARSSCPSRSPTTMMPGVVSVPHGWGHGRTGVQAAGRADACRA